MHYLNKPNWDTIDQRPFLILTFNIMVILCLFWPGILSPDSVIQYDAAKQGIYSDHHPALMSFVWRYLDQLIEGPILMFFLHMGFLYTALIYGLKMFKGNAVQYLFVFFPIFPTIAIYLGFIWKDIGYTTSFSLAALLICYSYYRARPMKIHHHLMFWLALFYGSAVKFQAQYVAGVLIVAYCYHHANFWFLSKVFCAVRSLALAVLFYASLHLVNSLLIPSMSQSQSWQLVKLYDLAALSIDTHTNLLPKFVQQNNFSFEKLQQFNPKAVDDLVFGESPLLRKGINISERQELWSTWFEAIQSHPLIYLHHRMRNLNHMLLDIPGYMYIQKWIHPYVYHDPVMSRITNKVLYIGCFIINSHGLLALLSLFYWILGFMNFNRLWQAKALITLNSIGLITLGILFFMSMAGVPRYTYIIAFMTHLSHAFAWICYKNSKQLIKNKTDI